MIPESPRCQPGRWRKAPDCRAPREPAMSVLGEAEPTLRTRRGPCADQTGVQRGEKAEEAGPVERRRVRAEVVTYEACAGGSDRRADLVGGEDPAEHDRARGTEVLPAERDRRRHRCHPVEAVEDD